MSEQPPDYLHLDEEGAKKWREFIKWSDFLSLGAYGFGVRASDRLETATRAVEAFRRITKSRGASREMNNLAVRVVADTFADQIEAAGQNVHDNATIRWVVAGLRCPSAPFCSGCIACQSVTSPLRPNQPRKQGVFDR